MEENLAADVTTRNAKEFMEYAYGINAIRFPPEGFRLKSGRISPYFFSTDRFCTGDSISKLAQTYAAIIARNGLCPDVIFGPAYGGIALAVTVAQAIGGNTGFAFNRKERKFHGAGGLVVGDSLEGKKVLIVDDVMTTGSSSGEAVEIIRKHDGIPIGCVVAFDRQERARDDDKCSARQTFEKSFEIPVYTIATLADLVSFLKKNTDGTHDERIQRGVLIGKILVYLNQYKGL